MFFSKDGRKSGSAFVAKRRDAEAAKSEPEGGKPAQMGKETMGKGAGLPAKEPTAMVGASNIEPEEQGGHAAMQVAQEHGPATNVTVHHDHKNNKHHVVSHHPNGHMHTSDHQSAAEAHEEGSKLAGGASSEADPMQGQTEVPEADGFKMPHLA